MWRSSAGRPAPASGSATPGSGPAGHERGGRVTCRACRSADVKLLFTIEHVPVQSYLRLSGAGKPVPTIDLRIYQCVACSMIQLLEPAGDGIAYEDTLVAFA